jgi:hypothetical protein
MQIHLKTVIRPYVPPTGLPQGNDSVTVCTYFDFVILPHVCLWSGVIELVRAGCGPIGCHTFIECDGGVHTVTKATNLPSPLLALGDW